MAETRVAGSARIAEAFERARGEGRAALMPYAMGGYPDADGAAAVLGAYASRGADIVELGVPFSDPLADGPVIHAAATRALKQGATYESVLASVAEVSTKVPVVLMVYANMVLARGAESFAEELEHSGVCGAIVPDLPPEESGEVRDALAGRGLALIPLVAPTTPPQRRARIGAEASGFVYLVSDTRTTGERDELPAGLAELIAATQADAGVPVAVGFGISTPEQVAQVGAAADGVIVGSRLVRAAGDAAGSEHAADAVGEFVAAAREALAGQA